MLTRIKPIFRSMLDFIFPVSDEQEYLESITTEKLMSEAEIAEDIKKDVFAIFRYEGLVRRMILCLKNSYSEKIAETFAEVLYPEILDLLSEITIFQNFEKVLIIPIPLSKKRLKKRGFNQTELIAKKLTEQDATLIFELDTKSLIKIKETPKQALAKTRKERLENPKGCFAIKNPSLVSGRNIILLDDVYTTGGTTKEARRVLKEAGAKKIIIFTIAH